MFTRREVILGAVAAGTAALAWKPSEGLASASQPSTPVNFAVPEGACDCHVHTFDPQHFPYSPSRPYTPEPVSVEELRSLHKALHISRVIVVQTTVYAADNSGVLDAMKKLGARSRGVAVIDEKTPDSALDEMDRAGIRGMRLNLETAGQTDPEIGRRRFQAAVERIKNRKWHIQIYARLSVIEGIKDQVAAAPMPVVFDHFGGMQAALGVDQPGFSSLMTLIRTGKAYVKISAPYRSSTLAPDYPDVAPLARALVASNPQRILWGSDWPHPGVPVPGRSNAEITPFFQIDDGARAEFAPQLGSGRGHAQNNPGGESRQALRILVPLSSTDFSLWGLVLARTNPRRLKPAPLVLRRWRIPSRIISACPARGSRSAAAAILRPILAFLLLLVELFLLLVVEQRANLIVRVLADLHHFLAHGLPVAAGIVSHIFHFFLRVHENRLDFRLLVGRQVEVLGHSLQLVIRRHRPSAAASSLSSSVSASLIRRGRSAGSNHWHGQQQCQNPEIFAF